MAQSDTIRYPPELSDIAVLRICKQGAVGSSPIVSASSVQGSTVHVATSVRSSGRVQARLQFRREATVGIENAGCHGTVKRLRGARRQWCPSQAHVHALNALSVDGGIRVVRRDDRAGRGCHHGGLVAPVATLAGSARVGTVVRGLEPVPCGADLCASGPR